MKGSISSGAIYAGNLQGVSGTITTDANGDGTTSLTFRQKMKKIPAIVVPSIQEADITGTLVVTSRTQKYVILQVDGSSVTSSTLSVGAIAFDDTYF